GDVNNFSHPYSLGVLKLGFDFTEILIGLRTDESASSLGNQVFKLEITKAMLMANAESNFEVSTVTTVRGPCKPPDGPSMLQHAGYADLPNHSHSREEAGTTDGGGQYGLVWFGFEPAYGNCMEGGNLEHPPGAIFVR